MCIYLVIIYSADSFDKDWKYLISPLGRYIIDAIDVIDVLDVIYVIDVIYVLERNICLC